MIKGFMGRTHALLSIMLLCICMLIPVDFLKQTIWLMKDNVLFFIVGIILVSGGALLPDLDNCQSFAGATLGPVGSMCTTFMQSTSSIFWNLLHGKGDKPPPTQHRYFWHTLIAGAGVSSMFIFGLKGSDQTLVSSIKASKDITTWFQQNTALVFFIIFIFVAVLIGSDMVLGKLIKFFNLPKLLNYILPVAMVVYIFFIDMTKIRILGICVGLGFIFHCLEDCFADSGVPLLWPIPIKRQMWHRIRLIPITIQTGSLANTLLDISALVVDIILIVMIFTTKTAAAVPVA